MNIKYLFIGFILFISVLMDKASCEIIYIRSDGSGDYPTIQEAINNANSDDTVSVAAGTYSGEGNINIDFGENKQVAVVSENGRENTIIDCQNNGRAFYFHNNETNAVFDSGGNYVSGSLVDGFTIINARTEYGGAIRCGEYKNDGPYTQPGPTINTGSPTIRSCTVKNSYSAYVGAAIAINSSSPVIQNCIIINNRAEWYGGGISCRNNSNPIIEDCTISDNTAYWGGGIYCYGIEGVVGVDDVVEIRNCIIKKNTTSQDGGGISLWLAAASISGCVIWGNSSYFGAGITAKNSSSPTIFNCVIAMNYAGGFGGGVHSDYNSKVTINNSTISENFAYGGDNAYTSPFGYPAGGIYSLQSALIEVTDSILWDNSFKDAGLYMASRIDPDPDNRNYGNSSEISGSCITSERVILDIDDLEQEELDSRQRSLDLEQNNYSDQGGNIFVPPEFEGNGKYTPSDNSPCRDSVGGPITIGARGSVLVLADSENITPRPPAEEDEEFYECFISSAIHTR